jgi:hypothetical protein
MSTRLGSPIGHLRQKQVWGHPLATSVKGTNAILRPPPHEMPSCDVAREAFALERSQGRGGDGVRSFIFHGVAWGLRPGLQFVIRLAHFKQLMASFRPGLSHSKSAFNNPRSTTAQRHPLDEG